MSLKFVTRKLKTQTLGDDEGDLNEVKGKDVASGDNLKPESSKTDVSIVNIHFSRERRCLKMNNFSNSFHKPSNQL